MKKNLLFPLLFFFFAAFSQSDQNQWTWLGGDELIPAYGRYGVKGVPDDTNNPGARSNAVTWRDAAGNLWLFGGYGYAANANGTLNDLWKYNPATNQWTWISGESTTNQLGVYGTKGVANAANKPGSRAYGMSWIDNAGIFWLYGGSGYGASANGTLNDLWKYNPTTNQWTWVSGDNTVETLGVYRTKGTAAAGNKPGARYNAASWVDASGYFWIFGGQGFAATGSRSNLNDLWRYNPANNQWTWISGDNVTNTLGVYGTKGTAAAGNKPGARYTPVNWADASGNLYLFGGSGYAATGTYGDDLNDLWRYNIATNRWTWISGDNTLGANGVYGTKGVAAATNKPGARSAAVGWKDATGNFYLFGGRGKASTGSGVLNDLWKYSPAANQWTWVSGDNTVNGTAVHGTRGIPDAANKPGARQNSVVWTDASGDLWLGGGGANLYCNDLWKFNPATAQWTWVSGDVSIFSVGVYGTKGVADAGNKPGARQNAMRWTDASGNLWLYGGYGFTTAGNGYLGDLWKYTPSSGQWTWMAGEATLAPAVVHGTKGVADDASKPGGRQNSMTWTDASGNLWLFGGYSPIGMMNDLWRYSPATNQWTWVSGDNTGNQAGVYGTKGVADPTNKPGRKHSAVTWTDASGKLWLFGGDGSGISNDLWRFDPATNLWTWMSGDNTTYQMGVYGTKGVADAANKPGARSKAVSFADASGNLWLFGGEGRAAASGGSLNDLWKYDPLVNQWTWVAGDNVANAASVYGTKGVADAANKLGGRFSATGWSDASGKFWFFGGSSDANYGNIKLNDLWNYDLVTGQWTWMNGSNGNNPQGTYGTRGVADAPNSPGGRNSYLSWADARGNLYVFGGNGFSSFGNGTLNDLWKYATVPSSVLPVRWLDFTARKQQKSVLLNWRTASETASAYFSIERAGKEGVYEPVGRVTAAGNAATVSAYQFTDFTPLAGTNLYRLKQVDKDGKFTYSGIARVVMAEEAVHLRVIENPVRETLNLGLQLEQGQKLTLEIRDAGGRLVLRKEQFFPKGTSLFALPLAGFPKASYVVSAITTQGITSKIFSKQ